MADLTEIVVVPENVLNQIVETVESNLPRYLHDLENQFLDNIKLPMPKVYDVYVDPLGMKTYPGISIWVEQKAQEQYQRTQLRERITLVMRLVVKGNHGEKRCYRYGQALENIMHSLYCKIGLAAVPLIEYYPPIDTEAEFIKMADITVTVEKFRSR
jgi:hypothetical protein